MIEAHSASYFMKSQTEKYGRRYLCTMVCKCGFVCSAYGTVEVSNQMQGHLKTIAFLEGKAKEGLAEQKEVKHVSPV